MLRVIWAASKCQVGYCPLQKSLKHFLFMSQYLGKINNSQRSQPGIWERQTEAGFSGGLLVQKFLDEGEWSLAVL